MAERALVVAVDLPLVKVLLDSYATTGILSKDGRNDPYNPKTSGIFPAEAAAALTLEVGEANGAPRMLGYLANSDARDPLALSADCGQLANLLTRAVEMFGTPQALCPHATGTASHAVAEAACLARAFLNEKPSLHLLKPFLGHGIGAGSLLETVILVEFLRHQLVPANLADLFCPDGFALPDQALAAAGPIFKIAASLGGHNALVALR
jgi:3-oxoacyl-(acyl-carrier-protein) synthase